MVDRSGIALTVALKMNDGFDGTNYRHARIRVRTRFALTTSNACAKQRTWLDKACEGNLAR